MHFNQLRAGRALPLTYSLWVMVVVVVLFANAFFPAKARAIDPGEIRTVFVIGDLADGGDPELPIQAYIVYNDQLILAETWWVDSRLGGGVGLAVDEVNELLFLSFEQYTPAVDKRDADTDDWDNQDPDSKGSKIASDTIDVFDARTGSFLDSIYLSGTDNLAGMVVHPQRELLYVVDRAENDVFVYDTNTFLMYEHWYLPSGYAWAVDLLGDTLYVSQQASWLGDVKHVKWYDIITHQELGSHTFPGQSVGFVVTENLNNPADGPLIYATEFDGMCVFNPCNQLRKYAVGADVAENWNIGDDGKGISANTSQNLIYLAQGSPTLFGPPPSVKVVDAATGQVLNEYPLDDSWKPTDVVASPIPFGGSVSKTCTSHPSGNLPMETLVTFEIEIMNRSDDDLVFIPLEDEYDTSQLTFISATPEPIDLTNDGQLNWANLAISFGGPLGPSESFIVEVQFETVTCTDPLNGSNLAKVEDALDEFGRHFSAAGVVDYLIMCGCAIDADCDDGLFCNGLEYCDEEGLCQPALEPCADDGLYCNGLESCDEKQDRCNSTGNPCLDDGEYCNGLPTCVEETDECVQGGPPCTDDDLFCNGVESCNEQTDACDHSGDPCESDEECNEATDSCDAGEITDDDSPPDEEGEDEDLWPKGKVTGGCCGC